MLYINLILHLTKFRLSKKLLKYKTLGRTLLNNYNTAFIFAHLFETQDKNPFAPHDVQTNLCNAGR